MISNLTAIAALFRAGVDAYGREVPMRHRTILATIVMFMNLATYAGPVQLHLFVDDQDIVSSHGVQLKLHSPLIQGVAFCFDAPWEGYGSGYVTMLKDADEFRMYYRGGGERTQEVTCLATSRDGVSWTRPVLNLVNFDGSTSNNIVLRAKNRKSYGESHNFSPFLDTNPSAPVDARYKALGLGWSKDGEKKALVAFSSPDGIRWRQLQKDAVITTGSFDSQNIAFWDQVQKRYVCYLRHGRDGIRSVMSCTSPDFLNWSSPQWVEFDLPLEQFYTNAIQPYPRDPHWYIGFPMRFYPQRKVIGLDQRKTDGLSDAVFISSRDGMRFQRTFFEAFIRPGLNPANWGEAHGNQTPCWGILQTSPTEYSIYWLTDYGEEPKLTRGTVRLDGFVSANAPYSGGELVTRAVPCTGDSLLLNYASSAVGGLQVEVQDDKGRVIPGFALNDCDEIYGDEIARTVTWKGKSCGELSGRKVMLRFRIRDADLFSYRFADNSGI